MQKRIFKNEYVMDKKLLKEYIYQSLLKKMIFSGYIMFVLGIVLFFVLEGAVSYIVLSCGLLSGFITLFTPIFTIKNIEEVDKNVNNGKIVKTYIEFSKNIIMKEGKSHLEFEYNQIKQITETKNLILLKTSKSTAIVVFKDGFTVGNKEEFLDFINNKININ